jgi:hypothetical protein
MHISGGNPLALGQYRLIRSGQEWSPTSPPAVLQIHATRPVVPRVGHNDPPIHEVRGHSACTHSGDVVKGDAETSRREGDAVSVEVEASHLGARKRVESTLRWQVAKPHLIEMMLRFGHSDLEGAQSKRDQDCSCDSAADGTEPARHASSVEPCIGPRGDRCT